MTLNFHFKSIWKGKKPGNFKIFLKKKKKRIKKKEIAIPGISTYLKTLEVKKATWYIWNLGGNKTFGIWREQGYRIREQYIFTLLFSNPRVHQ